MESDIHHGNAHKKNIKSFSSLWMSVQLKEPYVSKMVIITFYPTALKGCEGNVFTHGVRMGRQREKVCPPCISETITVGS